MNRAAPPSSVLVYVGLDRVGDSLLKLPFVRGLRTAFPDARITWLAGKETSVYASVMADQVIGLLDEVIENAGIGLHPSELLRRPLGGRRFDLIIDTQRIFWASLSLCRIPHRRFISPAARFVLSSSRPARGYRVPKSMQRQLLDLLELASGRTFATPKRLDLDIAETWHLQAARLLPAGPLYVAFAPGSGGRPKCWPLARFIELARAQAARGRVPVFLLGPQESEWLAELRAAVPEARFPLQEDGAETTPLGTIALSQRVAASVSNDSGVGHMLAIGGRPLVSLFGPTVPEKFLPMTEALTIVCAERWGGHEMDRIPLAAVEDALEGWLGGGRTL